MAKRRLSLRQARRIAHRRAELARDPAGGATGRVVARYGPEADVEPAPGAAPLRARIRATAGEVVVGDLVRYAPDGAGGAVILAVLPRRTLLARPDASGRIRPLAANLDQLAVVFAPEPVPHQNLLDRYLVAAEHLGLAPLLVANKADLPDPAAAVAALVDLYREIGYPVVRVSARTGAGIAELETLLAGHTTAFVGQSGVGKSALVNRLCPTAGAAEGSLSEAGKGRHTTTTARLYHLPGGGELVDSPGIREFSLWHLPAADVAAGFREFRPWLGRCRFRDCRHEEEPGCALAAACARGEIRPERLTSYHAIVGEAQSIEARGGAPWNPDI
ncbi:MAG: putative ribosome biogenesis GTPase RsgA [Porticoccaceae bacterium]|nr:MAG: putative ribosome biogenesis GTPase RsgA [Porticoccaceae bacterium]